MAVTNKSVLKVVMGLRLTEKFFGLGVAYVTHCGA